MKKEDRATLEPAETGNKRESRPARPNRRSGKMLSDNGQDRQEEEREFSILGIAPWGFMLILSEAALVILLLIGFATGRLSFALWGLGQFALIFAAGAWFTRNAGKEKGQ
jgi:hypothetical protein